MVLLDVDENQIDWKNPDYKKLSPHLYRVQKLSKKSSGEALFFRHHITSILKDEEGNEVGKQQKTPNTFKGIKVTIDRLGRLRKAND